MTEAQVVGIGLIGMVAVTIYQLVRDGRKRHWGFALKRFANNWRPLIHIVLGLYGFLIGVMATPWIIEQSEKSTNEIFTVGLPLAYILILLAVLLWVIIVMYKPWVQYSEQEKEWIKEERDKFRAKVPKILQRFV